MLKLGLFAAFSIAMATAAFAEATLAGPVIVSPAGKVLVNQGKGFVPAADGLTLKTSDRIMVGKDGAVTLAYAKCSVVLKQGTLLTLPKGDLCAKTDVASLQNNQVVKIAPVGFSDTWDDYGSICYGCEWVGLGFAGSIGAFAAYSIATQPTVSKP